MSRKHFNELARKLGGTLYELRIKGASKEELEAFTKSVEGVALACLISNPNFNGSRFIEAINNYAIEEEAFNASRIFNTSALLGANA